MRIKFARMLQGLRLDDVVAKTGVDKPGVWRYENGLINPRTPRGRAVCRALGIDPEWAFEDWRTAT